MPFEKGQRNFTAGEISEGLYAAIELQKYNTGLRKCFNFCVMVQGGVFNRPGFEFITPVKDPNKKYRLLPFQFSTTQNYILEMGDEEMRVVRNGGLVIEDPKTITGISQANPAVLSSAAHGFTNGQWVFADDVVGMTEVNGMFFKVAGATTNDFQLQDVWGNPINSTAFDAYISGGTISRVYERSTIYDQDDLRQLRYTQSADVMTIAHPDYKLSDLTRQAR